MANTLKRDLKMDFLLDKGIALLWSKGYNATSVNDIVKAAKIPKGSFYFYFDSKEEFTVKALNRYFEDQFSQILEVLHKGSKSPKQRLLNFYEYRIKMLKEVLDYKMGCMGCNLANEMAEHSEAIRNVIAAKGEIVKNEIASVIELAQSEGEITNKMNANDLAGFIEDAGKGAMTSMKEMNDSYPIDNFIFMTKNLLLN